MPAAAQTAVTTLRFAGDEGAQRRCRRSIFGTRPTGRTSKGPDDHWMHTYLYLYQWELHLTTPARDARATAREQHTITAS